MSKYPFNGNAGVGTFPSLTLYPVPTSGDLKLFANPGDIIDVTTNASGSNVTYYDQNEMVQTVVVSETPAAIAAEIGRVPLTITQNSVTTTHWYGISQIHNIKESGTGSTVSISPSENQNTQIKDVAETPAAIIALIEAALPAAGGGGGAGTAGTITALGNSQATAAQIVTDVVRIIGGTAGMGVRLDTATAGELRMITNATLVGLFIYPAVGDFIEPSAVNEPVTIGAGESIILFSSAAGKWDNTTDTGNLQAVAASGTVQGGGQIRTGVTQAYIYSTAFGQTAVTLPPALANVTISVYHNGGATAAKLFPSGTDQIKGGGAGLSIFLSSGMNVDLVCDIDGNWIYSGSQMDTLAVGTIQAITTGGYIYNKDAWGTELSHISTGGLVLGVGAAFFQDHGAATPGGGAIGARQIASNTFNIDSCATEGDSLILTGVSNVVYVRNSGGATAYVYCPSGHTMNGITDGFIPVTPRAVIMFHCQLDTGAYTPTDWVASIVRAGTQDKSASTVQTQAGGTPITGPSVLCLTCANAADAYTITTLAPNLIYIQNAGANAMQIFPNSGGTINGGVVDASISLAAAAAIILQSNDGFDWISTLQ